MSAFVLLAQQTTVDLGPALEIFRNVMTALLTGGVFWIARTVDKLRTGQTELNFYVCGKDGKGGLLNDVHDIREAMKERNTRLDDDYEGEERRHGVRRMRDMIRAELAIELAALKLRGAE